MFSGLQWSWLSIVALAGALIGTAGLGGVLKTWLDHLRGKRKQTDGVALELVRLLKDRVDDLETAIEGERERCDQKLAMQEKLIVLLRHRVRGSRQMVYSMLHLFDIPAARRKEMLVGIRSELAAMEQAEAIETGIVISGSDTSS